jgi:hypothetical protein
MCCLVTVGKHVLPVKIIEGLLEAVFSVEDALRFYNEDTSRLQLKLSQFS